MPDETTTPISNEEASSAAKSVSAAVEEKSTYMVTFRAPTASVRALDALAAKLSSETGRKVTRSDILNGAIDHIIRKSQ